MMSAAIGGFHRQGPWLSVATVLTLAGCVQNRDRYESNAWAVTQTRFDPSLPDAPPHQRIRIVAGGPPPGAAVAAGAVTGAVLDAAVSNPWHAGRGTVIGALTGAAIGGIADAERNSQLNTAAERETDVIGARSAALVLPPFYTTVWVAGLPYYYANDSYYRWHSDLREYEVVQPPETQGQVGTTAAPTSDQVFSYPRNGQSSEQQADDRYACHRSAVDQTRYDPTIAGGGVSQEVAAGKRADYFRAQAACSMPAATACAEGGPMTHPVTFGPITPGLLATVVALTVVYACPVLAAPPTPASHPAIGAVGFVDVVGPTALPDCSAEEAALQSAHRLLDRDSERARERRAELALENERFIDRSSTPADLAQAETNAAADRAEAQADRLMVDRDEQLLEGSACDPAIEGGATGQGPRSQPAPIFDVVFEVSQQYLLPLERALGTLPARVAVRLADPVAPQADVAATGMVTAVSNEASTVIVRARLENPPAAFRQGDVVSVALTLRDMDCVQDGAAVTQPGDSPCPS